MCLYRTLDFFHAPTATRIFEQCSISFEPCPAMFLSLPILFVYGIMRHLWKNIKKFCLKQLTNTCWYRKIKNVPRLAPLIASHLLSSLTAPLTGAFFICYQISLSLLFVHTWVRHPRRGSRRTERPSHLLIIPPCPFTRQGLFCCKPRDYRLSELFSVFFLMFF